jgi:anti-repressor protein
MEIIKITKTEGGKEVVSARELYSILGVGTRFNDFMPRMIDYGFIENIDYSKLSIDNQPFNHDYVLTLDMAKHICMIQRTETGMKVRQYFIDYEKSKNTPSFKIPSTLSEALRLAADQAEQIEQQTKLLKEQEPQVLFAKALEISNQSILIGQLSKILIQNGIEIGQNRLFERLRSDGYLHKTGEQYNLPTQKSMELDLFEVKTTTINNPDGSVRVTRTTKVKPKGQKYFINKFLK